MTVSKERIFLFDIDGTLANGEHRQHYVRSARKNWAAYNELMHMDEIIEPVKVIYHALAHAGIRGVFLSGREGGERNEEMTRNWIVSNDLNVSPGALGGIVRLKSMAVELHMRKEKDYRPDDIVKEEIFRTHIEPKYEVIGVFDDRPRVVRKWKEMGIFVFNVYQDPDHTEF